MSPGVTIHPARPLASRVDKVLAKQGKSDKVLLRRRIEFRLATQPDGKMDQLRQKYKPINDVGTANGAKGGLPKVHKRAEGATDGSSAETDGLVESSGFRRAAHSLFASERLADCWRTVRPIGPGLHNLGNTCFLNAVLQCLTYTAPLAEYLLTREHSSSCRAGDSCILCKFESHVGRALSKRENSSISPKSIVGRLKLIAKHMRVGRQEDAHEFLRLLIESFQRSLLHGIDPKLDRRVQETTLMHHVFGGYSQSQVKCSRCNHESNTFEPLLDLSLDIQGGSTIAKALRSFTRPEVLAKDNRYRCEKCNKLVEATKQMSVYRLPRALTLQLKRFSSFGGGKISRFVEFPLSLNMKSYVSANSPERGPYEYGLYAVLVHSGGSSRSGHYYSFVKSPAGVWYELNDSSVRQVSERTVLGQTAYLLFYERQQATGSSRSVAKPAEKPAYEQRAVSEKSGHEHSRPSIKAVNEQKLASKATDGVAIATASDDMEALLERKLKLGSEPSERSKKKNRKSKNKRELAEQANGVVDMASSQKVPNGPKYSLKNLASEIAQPTEQPVAQEQLEDRSHADYAAVAEKISADIGTATSAEWIVCSKSSKSTPAADTTAKASSLDTASVVEWNEATSSKRAKAAKLAEGKPAAGEWDVSDVRPMRGSQYGASVKSWTGTASVADEAGAKEKSAKKRLRRPDMYDTEYDRGRVKKIKQKRDKFASKANPYQMLGERIAKR
ncbi:hypothetical protein IWW38_000514 [Coemansia aciculifera]|uniref:Uncharacterized protein n=1 Tax=Coemansia aciculifera TaxID=417176 RepID=A0ACC1MAY2_9FUNG|nr:hypothetical protein IWW38_000514 [Coemansia aciculifera]